jgi:hypothetical protein
VPIKYTNTFVSLIWFNITWMLFALLAPSSKFSKDDPLMVKWPKHVVKVNKNILLWLTKARNYLLSFSSINTTGCHIQKTMMCCHLVKQTHSLYDKLHFDWLLILLMWLIVTVWVLRWKRNIIQSNVYWTVHHCNSWRMEDQLDVTCYFISLLICSACFGH